MNLHLGANDALCNYYKTRQFKQQEKSFFLLFLSSEDQVAKMLLFNNGYHVNTWEILYLWNTVSRSYSDRDAIVCWSLIFFSFSFRLREPL